MKILFSIFKFFFFLLSVAVPWGLVQAQVYQVTTQDLRELTGIPVEGIRLYASDSKTGLHPIPFQIDQQVMDPKTKAWTWSLAAEAQFLLGAHDVCLFLAKDGGERLPLEKWPKAEKVFELTLTQTPLRVVYLTVGDKSARSTKNYVQYDAANDKVSGQTYAIQFRRDFPLLQESLILKNGKSNANVLDRFKFRLHLDFKAFFDFDLNEESINSTKLGVRSGPIRVIRRVLAFRNLGPIRLVPRSEVDFIFYPQWVEVPTRIFNPVNGPQVLGGETRGVSGYDFSKVLYGSQFYSSVDRNPKLFDGKPDDLDHKDQSFQWWILTGPAGSMILSLNNDTRLEALGVKPKLILRDDINVQDPPEREPGSLLVGFDLPVHRMPKGQYLLLIKEIFPERIQYGQEAKYIADAHLLPVQSVRAR